ncbi:VOC family protein [Alteraurantiacibacter aquimixticola]|uniref:VOC family protein n=1 Tax=Alteraurantiacibacter aquimixticola TaxID=2489173 RepID=A0A4T3F791_9SPHN|nr:VOC family protein [Alteraurantiacibacter aquimixticola]TIX51572.1 VOC family protein [Alteraurantiacibacter aquimixticola]
MTIKTALAGVAAIALAACAANAQDNAITTPEGALMDSAEDIAYAPGELTQAQLEASNADIVTGGGMNVFRRFPREITDDMVNFYVNALALRSLNPIQLTSTQQMILTGVGSMQIKLSAGQVGDRLYDLSGGVTGGTGIRYFRLTFPDAEAVQTRFAETGFDTPEFTEAADGTWVALTDDPGGFPIQIVIDPAAKDHSDDGVGVGIGVSDLAESRAFYREFVGLTELPPVEDAQLGVTKYPYNFNETTIFLHQTPAGGGADNGSAGIQYVVTDAPLAAARGDHRDIGVQTPLNKLRGFDLITVWLSDPDGVTNYFAQVGPNSRTAQGQN